MALHIILFNIVARILLVTTMVLDTFDMSITAGRKKAYSNVLGVGAEFCGQVAQREGAAGAHGCDVHICLHLLILHRHLHPLLMVRVYSDPTT